MSKNNNRSKVVKARFPTPMATKESLIAEMREAMAKSQYKLAGELGRKIAKLEFDEQKARREAQAQALIAFNLKLKKAIEDAIAPLQEELESFGDSIEGIWYIHNYSDTLVQCRTSRPPAFTRKKKANAKVESDDGLEEDVEEETAELVEA